MRLLILTLLVAGCATAANYDRKLNSFQGQPISAVVRALGTPRTTQKLPDGTTTVGYDDGQCETTFLTDASGQVTNWTAKGFCISR